MICIMSFLAIYKNENNIYYSSKIARKYYCHDILQDKCSCKKLEILARACKISCKNVKNLQDRKYSPRIRKNSSHLARSCTNLIHLARQFLLGCCILKCPYLNYGLLYIIECFKQLTSHLVLLNNK